MYLLELPTKRLHRATASRCLHLLRDYTAAFAFSWLPQHDPASEFSFIWSMENLGGPRMPEGKCLFAVVPYLWSP
jgi:hypothetical protein